MSTQAHPKDIEPIDLKKLYEATFVDKSVDEWNIQFMKPVDQLSQLLKVMSELKKWLEYLQKTESDDDMKILLPIYLNNRNFRPLINVLKEKCLSELKIEPQQLSIDEITRETIDKLFSFMTYEEIRIRRLKDSLDVKKENVNFYGQNEATYYPIGITSDDFEKYVKRGESIRADKHTHLQNILKGFIEVQRHEFACDLDEAPDTAPFPFFLICCSSGTGKTQLPFSLPQVFPVFYFLFNWMSPPGSQSIYNCFSSLSIALQMCIKKDLEQLRDLPGVDTEKSQKENEELATKKYKDDGSSQEDEDASTTEPPLSKILHVH